MLSENVLSEKAFSDHIRSEFLVPYEKSRFLISFSNSIRSGLRNNFAPDWVDAPKIEMRSDFYLLSKKCQRHNFDSFYP